MSTNTEALYTQLCEAVSSRAAEIEQANKARAALAERVEVLTEELTAISYARDSLARFVVLEAPAMEDE